MQTPKDKTVTFTFASKPYDDKTLMWEARLTFPPGATAETELVIDVADGNGSPIVCGELELAGMRNKISQGKGSMTYAQFISGRHDAALWLHVQGRESIPGGLTFR